MSYKRPSERCGFYVHAKPHDDAVYVPQPQNAPRKETNGILLGDGEGASADIRYPRTVLIRSFARARQYASIIIIQATAVVVPVNILRT